MRAGPRQPPDSARLRWLLWPRGRAMGMLLCRTSPGSGHSAGGAARSAARRTVVGWARAAGNHGRAAHGHEWARRRSSDRQPRPLACHCTSVAHRRESRQRRGVALWIGTAGAYVREPRWRAPFALRVRGAVSLAAPCFSGRGGPRLGHQSGVRVLRRLRYSIGGAGVRWRPLSRFGACGRASRWR